MSSIRDSLEEKFGHAQQELIDKFKLRLKDAADAAISDLYTDVAPFAATDAHTNYHNYLRDEIRASLIEEVTTKYGHYSWAHSIRMTILEVHSDVLRNKIIEDLQQRIQSLEEHIQQLQSRRFG